MRPRSRQRRAEVQARQLRHDPPAIRNVQTSSPADLLYAAAAAAPRSMSRQIQSFPEPAVFAAVREVKSKTLSACTQTKARARGNAKTKTIHFRHNQFALFDPPPEAQLETPGNHAADVALAARHVAANRAGRARRQTSPAANQRAVPPPALLLRRCATGSARKNAPPPAHERQDTPPLLNDMREAARSVAT